MIFSKMTQPFDKKRKKKFKKNSKCIKSVEWKTVTFNTVKVKLQ